MTFLGDLDRELTAAHIPARRRRRIVAEFTDHLSQDPGANLGQPAAIARQFADELGTRLARESAYRAFAVLALAGIFMAVMFLTGGRLRGWAGYGSYASTDVAGWWVPVMLACLLAGQVALACGGLAILRAWRLRRIPVITAADARVLNRRTALALVCGAITCLVVPLTNLSDRILASGSWWHYGSVIGAPIIIVLQLAVLPSVLSAARVRPAREGPAGDLTADLGPTLSARFRATPMRMAVALSLLILVAATALGIRTDDTYDGILRGLFDGGACMAGFIVLGRYLGLRTSS